MIFISVPYLKQAFLTVDSAWMIYEILKQLLLGLFSLLYNCLFPEAMLLGEYWKLFELHSWSIILQSIVSASMISG